MWDRLKTGKGLLAPACTGGLVGGLLLSFLLSGTALAGALGLGGRLEAGPTYFAFSNPGCEGGQCKPSDYVLLARKTDESVVWRVPAGQVMIDARELNSSTVYVLLVENGKSTFDIRFQRLDIQTGKLTPTPYRYLEPTAYVALKSLYLGGHFSPEKDEWGKPAVARWDLLGSDGKILLTIKQPRPRKGTLVEGTPCYQAGISFRFGLDAESEGLWRELRYSGTPIPPYPAGSGATPEALAQWCEAVRNRVVATRDAKGRWTARLAETLAPLLPATFSTAEEASIAGQDHVAPAIARQNAMPPVVNAWQNYADDENKKLMEDQKRQVLAWEEQQKPLREAAEKAARQARAEQAAAATGKVMADIHRLYGSQVPIPVLQREIGRFKQTPEQYLKHAQRFPEERAKVDALLRQGNVSQAALRSSMLPAHEEAEHYARWRAAPASAVVIVLQRLAEVGWHPDSLPAMRVLDARYRGMQACDEDRKRNTPGNGQSRWERTAPVNRNLEVLDLLRRAPRTGPGEVLVFDATRYEWVAVYEPNAGNRGSTSIRVINVPGGDERLRERLEATWRNCVAVVQSR